MHLHCFSSRFFAAAVDLRTFGNVTPEQDRKLLQLLLKKLPCLNLTVNFTMRVNMTEARLGLELGAWTGLHVF